MFPVFKKLASWYARNKRDLPWRRTRNPYRIFVSEIMLQQTQVDHVIPLYRNFLRCFPSWTSLARATTTDLLTAWAGLGYNRRALYLREAAKQVVEDGVPRDEEEWRMLKGVGPYAAAALTAFINRKPAVVIDTNIRRVVGRVIFGIPHPSVAQDNRVRRVLSDNMPTTPTAIADLPQAFMDLGSAICTVSAPACATCPLRLACKAAPKFLSGKIPAKKSTTPRERRHHDKPYPDRIYRGRILKWVREHGPKRLDVVGKHVDSNYRRDHDAAWIRAMVERLVKDGLLSLNGRDTISLPHS